MSSIGLFGGGGESEEFVNLFPGNVGFGRKILKFEVKENLLNRN